QIIHLHQGQIRQDSLYEGAAGGVGRVVNSWYRFRPLVAELVVQNACGHLGLKSDEICWTNSESFAAWCRFGKRIHLAENKVHTVRFHSLEDLIREKRRIDASGKLRVIKDLAIVDGKEEGGRGEIFSFLLPCPRTPACQRDGRLHPLSVGRDQEQDPWARLVGGWHPAERCQQSRQQRQDTHLRNFILLAAWVSHGLEKAHEELLCLIGASGGEESQEQYEGT
ncbi:PREDICTED: protein FAM84A-like, partial [Chlamydotis macqueenii]|uniref:protein FAM84A-like n=1 Tax=Chlamydotis macqueenii TaxID=187382 RepID=UPI000529EB81